MNDEANAGSVLLFDLGGVLVDFRGFERLTTLLEPPPALGPLKERWLSCEAVIAFEEGRLSPRDFALRFLEEWELHLSAEEFLAEFESWVGGFFPSVLDDLRSLGSRYRLACLSNTNPVHWRVMGPVLEPLMDACFLSYELGVAKPDAGAYRHVLTGLGVRPEDVIFFDDSPANLAAAAALGIGVEQVDGPGALRSAFERRGLVEVRTG